MTYDNLIDKLRQSEKLTGEDAPALRKLVDLYPYFGVGRWLYLKALYNSNSLFFGAELKRTALHAPNRRNLYFFIPPEELKTVGQKERTGNATGSYFDMLEAVENKNKNNPNSLRALAERLKAAREMLHTGIPEEHSAACTQKVENLSQEEQQQAMPGSDLSDEQRELEVKKCIREKKYREAIELLKELNFNNPKKSIYFADQIRYLEKILQNL